MKVRVWPADMWACGSYRLRWPAEALTAAGEAEVALVLPAKPGEGETFLRVGLDMSGRVVDAWCTDEAADVLVFQRPSHPHVAQAIPFLRERGYAVVVDVDDDLAAIDPRNPAFGALHPSPLNLVPQGFRDHLARTGQRLRDESPHSWAWIGVACASADVTTVSTGALADRYGRGNAIVVDNYLREKFLEVPRVDSDVIGWPGSTHSHPGDLRACGGGVAQAVRRGHPFRVVGDGTGADRDLGCAVESTGPIGFDEWPEGVGGIGVGIAPLAASRFNEAKSRLKLLELSGAGVPWVASPRPEYRRVHAEAGCGTLAEKPKEWFRALKRLCEDDVLRAEESERVRAWAATQTIGQHAWRILDAWQTALDRRIAGPVARDGPKRAQTVSYSPESV